MKCTVQKWKRCHRFIYNRASRSSEMISLMISRGFLSLFIYFWNMSRRTYLTCDVVWLDGMLLRDYHQYLFQMLETSGRESRKILRIYAIKIKLIETIFFIFSIWVFFVDFFLDFGGLLWFWVVYCLGRTSDECFDQFWEDFFFKFCINFHVIFRRF